LCRRRGIQTELSGKETAKTNWVSPIELGNEFGNKIERNKSEGKKMTTEERLEKLERELTAAKCCNRRLLTIVALTIGGLGLVWALTKTTSAAYAQEVEAVQKVVRANRFVLVDEKGKECAVLRVDKDGPALGLYDESVEPRIVLGVNKDGPALGLYDENGKPRIGLVVLEKESQLSLSNEKGKSCVILGLDKDGPRLALSDENGNPRALLSVLKYGPSLAMWDKNRKGRALLIADEDGPRLDLSDENGKTLWKAP
jgi:hypothetical protein